MADRLLGLRLFFSKQEERKCFQWLLNCRPQFLQLKARAGRSWGARDGGARLAGPVGEEGSLTSGPKGVLGDGVRGGPPCSVAPLSWLPSHSGPGARGVTGAVCVVAPSGLASLPFRGC